jgi:hypothetical protein
MGSRSKPRGSKRRCEYRLTVIGSKREVRRFQAGAWEKTLRVRYPEPLEFSPCRFVCQFQTNTHELKRLQSLSRRWAGLVLLLDFEIGRIKGLAKARAGELEHCEIGY